MLNGLLRNWLKVDEQDTPPQDALRGLLDALDALEPARARHLARFAYMLGRVAHADQHVSPDETRLMEELVQREGGISADQALLVVGLAKHSNRLFGGTDNFIVAREFAAEATTEQTHALLRCLFSLSASEGNISVAEEREIQRIARELRVDADVLLAMRLEYRKHLPGLRTLGSE